MCGAGLLARITHLIVLPLCSTSRIPVYLSVHDAGFSRLVAFSVTKIDETSPKLSARALRQLLPRGDGLASEVCVERI